MEKEGLWSTIDAARVSGLTVDMLNYFQRTGIFASRKTQRNLRGKPRAYAFADLIMLSAIGTLAASGVSVLRLKKPFNTARRALAAALDLQPSGQVLVATGKRALLVRRDALRDELQQFDTAMVLIDLDRVILDVTSRVESL